MSELVERGEKMLRDGLGSPRSNPSKLNDSICAQLCEEGLEALARATRYNTSRHIRLIVFTSLMFHVFNGIGRFCCEKSPEAIRILLPDETSPAVSSVKSDCDSCPVKTYNK